MTRLTRPDRPARPAARPARPAARPSSAARAPRASTARTPEAPTDGTPVDTLQGTPQEAADTAPRPLIPAACRALAPEPASLPALVLEFELAPALAGRLTRHPAIRAARQGRGRTAAEELIWLDSAEGELAARDLALETTPRGPRRLLRTRPEAPAPWLPGTPPALAGDAAEATDLARGALVPIAAFSGRRSLLALMPAEGPVQAELLAGKLRSVAAERPVARLRLAGAPAAVLALANRLVADLPLLPPRAALAEEGRALARGDASRPRRRGPADLATANTVEAAFVGAVGHLLEVMLHHAPGCALGQGPEGVHQMRVALRRLRSVLKAFRPAVRSPALDGFDDALKRLAQRLGPARDWDVFLPGVGAAAASAIGPDRRMAALTRAAEARRQAAYGALRQALDGPGFRRLVLDGIGLLVERPWRGPAATPEEIDALASRLPLLDGSVADFAAGLLDKRWHRLREQGEKFDALDAEALHEVRLEAKRLRYNAEIFAPVWSGKGSRRFLKRLAVLQEDLGVANDTSVARALVASLGAAVPAWAVGAVEGFAMARVAGARKHAVAAWEELMLAEPFWSDV